MTFFGQDILTTHYEVFIDNVQNEDALISNQESCAGDFSVLLQPFLDLAPLLYLR